MREPRWLTATVVLAIHTDQIKAHGGFLGLRDRGLLESSLDRARNRYLYESGSDLFSLAASYGFGLVRNHPFVDGNKRVAFQTMYLFLGLNGLKIETLEEKVVHLMLALADGAVDEAELSSWLRDHTVPR